MYNNPASLKDAGSNRVSTGRLMLLIAENTTAHLPLKQAFMLATNRFARSYSKQIDCHHCINSGRRSAREGQGNCTIYAMTRNPGSLG